MYTEDTQRVIHMVGFWAALVAFIADAGYTIVQIAQILSVTKFPLDAILIYGFSLGIEVPFLLAMLALHYTVPEGKKIWTHAAVLFSVMYATYVTLNYTVQLGTVIPMKIAGTLGQNSVLDQTPHSLFWDVDALGYIFLGLATLFAVPVFSRTGFERWVKWFFLANAIVTPLIAFVYFYPNFSETVLLLATPWLVTSLGSMLFLTLFFRRLLVLHGQRA